jgi:hypothetical protein
MARLRPSRLVVVLVIVVSSLSVAGAASAFWASAGGGRGSGATDSAQSVTLTPAVSAAGLYPGGAADVSLTVTNPNRFPVRVPSLSLDTRRGTGGFAVDAGHAGCGTATFGFPTQTDGGSGWTVPARGDSGVGVLPVTLTAALSMGLGAANACQGATVTVYLTAGP